MRDYRDVPDTDAPDGEHTMDIFDKLWEFLKALVKSFLEGWGRY